MTGAAFQLPESAVCAISAGTPASALIGALVGNLLVRRGAKELDRRSRREEVMRNLRWAAELAVSPDGGRADLGVAELVALSRSDLLDDEARGFIDAALNTVVDDPAERLGADADNSEAVPAAEQVLHLGPDTGNGEVQR